MKYLLLDVAGTLLHKPSLYPKMQQVLRSHGYEVDLNALKYHHKILSEAILFPDRTNERFYENFNKELLYSLGIISDDILLNAIFSECSYLPWEPFADTDFLTEINLPIGILSNFNATLKAKLKSFFKNEFAHVFVSEELGSAKPSRVFYQKAIDNIGVKPEEIIYVGDSIKLDLEPALSFGMKAFLIDRENYFPMQKSRISTLTDLRQLL